MNPSPPSRANHLMQPLPEHLLQDAARMSPYVLAPPRPFQFPSLQHFDERVQAVLARAAELEEIQPSTVRWMRDGYHSFRTYIVESKAEKPALGGEFVQQRDVLAGWCAWLLKRGRSRISVRTYWRAMAALCERIEAADGMTNPFRWFRAPRVGRLLPKSLTADAARTIVLFAKNYSWPSPFARSRNVAVIGCMLLAGLRRAEVWKLRVEDVEEHAGVIHIRRGKGRFGGKDRTAYLPPQLRDMLAEYRRERTKLRRGTPLFFTAERRDGPLTAIAVRRLFAVVSEKTGVHVTPHRLRHTYATLLRQAGIADRVSMDLLGHEQLATLQRYSHVFEPEYLREVERLAIDLG